MTSKKECYLCTELHTDQLADTLYACDKHTYLTVKQVCDLLQVKREAVWRYQKRGWLTRYIIGTGTTDTDRNPTRYSLSEVKKLIKTEAK